MTCYLKSNIYLSYIYHSCYKAHKIYVFWNGPSKLSFKRQLIPTTSGLIMGLEPVWARQSRFLSHFLSAMVRLRALPWDLLNHFDRRLSAPIFAFGTSVSGHVNMVRTRVPAVMNQRQIFAIDYQARLGSHTTFVGCFTLPPRFCYFARQASVI